MESRKNLKKKQEQEGKKERASKKKIIIATFLILFSFFGSFLIYFIMQIALDTSTPMVVVISGSMEPTINKGDLLFLRGMDPEHIKERNSEHEGDIIVYDASGLWEGAPEDPIVHRVIDKFKKDGKWYFITKGDANKAKDEEPVPGHRILGVVVGRIPYVGWIKIMLTEFSLFIPILIILSVPLVVSIFWDLLKPKKEEDEKNEEKIEKFKDSTLDKKIKDVEQYLDKIEAEYRKDDDTDDFN